MNVDGARAGFSVWALFDPGKQLPRDPARFNVDLSGLMTLGFDLLDAEAYEDPAIIASPPVDLNALTIADISFAVAGLVAQGDGAFTFDASDKTSFSGFPRPQGQFSFVGSGSDHLLDTLAEMGILSDDDLIGLRLGMAMFAESTGDDALRSTLEINAAGDVMLNGQQIK
jgi:hypothetical protein